MIETIFYFANSKTEYDANANSGNISARTISFVPTGNGVGDIYKNGIKYGCGISESSINEIINNLPFASTTQAGIIKLGKGLKSVGNDGTVGVDFTGLNGTDGIDGLDGLVENILKTIIDKNGTGVVVTPRSLSGSTVAIADIKVGDTTKTIYAPTGSNSGSGSSEGKDYAITNFGKSGTSLTISQNNNTAKSVDIKDVVKSSIQNLIDNGDTIVNNFGQKTQVSVNPTLTSGTQIATITVDGTSKTLYAPTGSGSGGGGSEPYDDTDIKNAIRDLQDRANQTESDLRDLLDETEEEVREKFKNAFSTYEDLIDYYKQSGDTTPTKFTFGKEDADEWASQMGLVTPNGDGTYNVGWSTLTQSYNSLAGEVAQIKANQSAGGEIDYEALSAGLYSYIDENAATSGMDSTWGKFVKKDDGEIQMLEWMESAIKTYASNQEAYARLLAAAKDYDENGDTIQEGIARIHAFVEKDSNGNYVAGTSLASMIDDGVNNSLSEVFTENSSNSAVAGLYARLSDVEDTADDNYEAISGLQNKVEKINGEYIAKADLVTSLKNKKDEIMSASGLDISASINAATSNLSSQIEGTYAKISTTVTKDPVTKKIESEVRLNADQIYLDGTTWADIINADSIISNKVTTAYIKGMLDGENMENIWIDADHIYLDGTTWAELINAEQIVADQLESQNIKTSELEVFGNGTKLSINGTNGILLEGQSSNPYHFAIDGSGQLANSAISWDSFGNISFGSKFISAANANLSVDSLVATKTGAGTTTVDGNGFSIEGVQSESAIRSDGSGYFADGAISWDTSGNITLGSKFINAVNANLTVNKLQAGSSNKIYVDSSNGVYVDGTCDSKINPNGSGYLGNNAITWGTDGSGSIANGAITWGTSAGGFSGINALTINGSGTSGLSVIDNSSYRTDVWAGEIDLTTGGVGSNLRGGRLLVGNQSGHYYEYTSNGPEEYSDVRKKDIIEDETISIESIAAAPLFKYKTKDHPEDSMRIGSSAQYWQDLVPEAVSSDEEGYLKMNYMTLNTVASLTSAKEIVKLKEENATLKQRVEALEARLQLIENKLNA